jgi:protein-export membrane protein SecD/preprotein translocase SecF subunit
MLNLSRWKVILVVLATVFGVLFTLPNLLPQQVRDQLPGFLPSKGLNLGLDLQGGSYLLYSVDTDALKTERLTNMLEDVRSTLSEKQIAFTDLGQRNGEIGLRITDPRQLGDAGNLLRQTVGAPLAGVQGGRDVDVATAPDQRIRISFVAAAFDAEVARAVEQSIEIIRRRIDQMGTKEPDIARQGKDRIVIQAAGESDPERLKALIGQTAKLTFQMVDETASPADVAAGRVPPGDEVLPSTDGQGPSYVVKKRSVVTGEMLTSAQAGFDQQSGQPDVSFRFNGVGARRFGDVTRQNIGKRFAIVLDRKVISAPVIQSAITGGSGQITGHFTQESANDLAVLLRAGALPVQLKVEEQRTVGAELGADAVRAGTISALVGLAATVVFMIAIYGFLFGGISLVALVVNAVMIIGVMSFTQATLTLPGIAGLILTLAVAVDANVLIYERMRDELRAGRSLISSMDSGFARAMGTILDANMTHILSALIMFQFGSGPVRGFAWTLAIGVLTTVFSAVLVTQVLLGWWFKATRPKSLPIAEGRAKSRYWPLIKVLPVRTHFSFVRLARLAAILSVLAIAGSLFLTLIPFKPPCGGLACGIDFKGGTVLEISTAPAVVDLGKARGALNGMGLGDVQVQGFGSPSSAMVRFQTPNGADASATVRKVQDRLSQTLSGVKFVRTDLVGPKVSSELLTSGVMGIGLAILLMLIYIWFRFELQFGLGAVAALFHDVFLTFGLIAIMKIEFNLQAVAAILTIIGYSMNDTVVVFDRFRENLRKYKRMPLREVIDMSINEMLTRTIITSMTAILALVALAVFGGPSLYGLSVIMLFGIVIGTYSSIYIAAPVILLWGVKRLDEEAVPLKPAGQRT